jgi:7-cyano-7-deazaguanine synthase
MIDAQIAIVLFSGGQDSTTCLGWAIERFERVETVGFDYGQRHRAELDVRPKILNQLRRDFPAWGTKLGQDHLLDMNLLAKVSETALTRDVAIAMEDTGLLNTFVPGRAPMARGLFPLANDDRKSQVRK